MKINSMVISLLDDGEVRMSVCGVVYYKDTPIVVSVNDLVVNTLEQHARIKEMADKMGTVLEQMLLESELEKKA